MLRAQLGTPHLNYYPGQIYMLILLSMYGLLEY
jgi:hypothetical protein